MGWPAAMHEYSGCTGLCIKTRPIHLPTCCGGIYYALIRYFFLSSFSFSFYLRILFGRDKQRVYALQSLLACCYTAVISRICFYLGFWSRTQGDCGVKKLHLPVVTLYIFKTLNRKGKHWNGSGIKCLSK